LRLHLISGKTVILSFQFVMDSIPRWNDELRRVSLRKNIPSGSFAMTALFLAKIQTPVSGGRWQAA
jgi:hypothetical protein